MPAKNLSGDLGVFSVDLTELHNVYGQQGAVILIKCVTEGILAAIYT